MFWLWK